MRQRAPKAGAPQGGAKGGSASGAHCSFVQTQDPVSSCTSNRACSSTKRLQRNARQFGLTLVPAIVLMRPPKVYWEPVEGCFQRKRGRGAAACAPPVATRIGGP